jgi:formamidopyrimidine-DNA glycosylase
MPELPEVETVRRTLYDKVVGRTVERVEIITPRQIWHPDPDTFRAEVEGVRFTEIDRLGKWLLFRLGAGDSRLPESQAPFGRALAGNVGPGKMTLVAHLRMSGHLYVSEPDRPRDKHCHVIFHLDNGTELRYDDQRKFGGFHLLLHGHDDPAMPPGLRDLGPEPLSDAFTPEVLRKGFRGRRAPVKAMLLNQKIVAGLGNIYVDEALFCAQVHPARPAESLTPEETDRLYGCIRSVLSRAVEKRGTTFSLYFDGEGQEGDMYDELQVFDRSGDPCPRCGTPIVKLAVAQRGTHVCPACQRAPEGAVLATKRARSGRRSDSVTVAAEPPKAYKSSSKRKMKGE